ncbi:MAG: hypothetical protein GY765_40420 [bacterium]|nr:hypothetical protein [bacterium]
MEPRFALRAICGDRLFKKDSVPGPLKLSRNPINRVGTHPASLLPAVISFVFVLIFLSLPLRAEGTANTPCELITRTRQALTRITPFKLHFVQQVFSDEQMDIEEEGEVLFKDKNTLKWTYLKPDYKVFLLEGKKYRFYDLENEQMIVGGIHQGRQWIWRLLFSDGMIGFTRCDKKQGKIFIKKDDPEEPLDIVIRLDEHFLPVEVVQKDSITGIRMVYQFGKYVENTDIPKDAFQLTVPDDVEIITDPGTAENEDNRK